MIFQILIIFLGHLTFFFSKVDIEFEFILLFSLFFQERLDRIDIELAFVRLESNFKFFLSFFVVNFVSNKLLDLYSFILEPYAFENFLPSNICFISFLLY
jgi:hypothetical protein